MFDISVITTIVVFLVTLFLVWCVSTLRERQTGPPGPFPLPVLGNFLLLARNASRILDWFTDLAQEHGPVMTFRLGSVSFVMINDAKVLQEAFVKKASDFSNRPCEVIQFMKIVDRRIGSGLIFMDGQPWQELRRLSLTSMREMGVGKKSLEEKVMEETSIILDTLAKVNGQPYFIKPLLSKATSNVICNVVFGARFEHDDPKFVKLLSHIEAAFKVNPVFQMINFFPFLQYIPGFMKGPMKLIRSLTESNNYVKELMEEHEMTFDPDNIRDFVDLLIDLRRKNKKNVHFTESNMRRVIVDLFTAGSDSTSTALYWAMLYMAAYPDIQRRCQDEIDTVVGKSRQVTQADKVHLKYTEATLLECIRMGHIAPFTVPHCTSRDTSVLSYHIPRNTVVLGHLRHMGRDPHVFPEPEEFRPERFLDQHGNVVHRDRITNFSMGPRSCIGEILAKMELNLMFPSILQFYTVCPASDSLPVDLQPQFGLTVAGKEQLLVFKKR